MTLALLILCFFILGFVGGASLSRYDLHEATSIIKDLTNSIEAYNAQSLDFNPMDEYDAMMFPYWKRAFMFLRKLQ